MLMGMDIPNMPIEYRQTGIRRVCPPPSRNTPPTLAGGVTVAKRRAPPGTTRRGPAVVGLGHGVRHRTPVSYTHLRAHETKANLVCRLLLEKKKKNKTRTKKTRTERKKKKKKNKTNKKKK